MGIFIFTPNIFQAYALSGAKWGSAEKNTIVYENKTYVKTENKSNFPREAQDGTAFVYNQSGVNTEQITELISVDSTEKDSVEGKFYRFNVSALGIYRQNGNSEPITVEGISEENQSSTSCDISGGGGWMICMISNTLAGAMDGLYDVFKGFLVVQPLQTTSESGIYRVWDYMRNIANIFFVIIFILVIYSQITNVGISNYGIKKMLPKLIVAAILINISYFICSIAVDLSNIIGSQLQDLLINIRKEIFENGSGIQVEALNWGSLTAGILSGGGSLAMGGYVFFLSGGTQTLGLTIAIVLLIVLYSVFVAVVILAARQAIITVLVFLAPLAFVANIWPNTEKWFDRWRDLFTTMLVMYPIIALLFGGSQLAGITIIVNANGNIVTLILGMVVQVVPLAITPTIMRLSGNLLGKFAGMINNPDKGPIDSAKNFLRDQREIEKYKKIEKDPKSLVARANQLSYNRKRRVNAAKPIAEKYQENMAKFEDEKQIRKAMASEDAAVRDRILANNITFRQEMADLAAKNTEQSTKAAVSGLKAELLKETFKFNAEGDIIGLDSTKARNLGNVSSKLYDVMNSIQANQLAAQNNESMIANSLAETMKKSDDLQNIASGQRGESGKIFAVSRAFEQASKQSKEEIAALASLVKNANFDKDDYDDIFLSDKTHIEKDNMKFEINRALRAATAENFMNKASMPQAIQAIDLTGEGMKLHSNRADLVEAFSKAKKDDLQFIGGGFLGDVSIKGAKTDDTIGNVLQQYAKNVSDERIMKASDESLGLIWTKENIANMSQETIRATLKSIQSINSEPQKYGRITAAQGHEIHKALNDLKKSHSAIYDSILGANWKPDNIKNMKPKK
ncbi:MAG: hypothetical protein Q4A27_01475 [bacterium]|nr:hypothetical protein [bacterium]